jgi:hypothetical protein
MMRPKVYLAGACEVEDSWRDRAARELDKLGYDPVNPLRGEKLRKRGTKGDVTTDIPDALLVSRDHYDLNHVLLSGGLILMNLNTTPEGRQPLATLMELEWSWMHRVPVVAIIGRDTAPPIRNHPWIKHMVSYSATSLTAALVLIESYFTHDDHTDAIITDEEGD